MPKKKRKSSSKTERLDMGGASWEDALTIMTNKKVPSTGVPPRPQVPRKTMKKKQSRGR